MLATIVSILFAVVIAAALYAWFLPDIRREPPKKRLPTEVKPLEIGPAPTVNSAPTEKLTPPPAAPAPAPKVKPLSEYKAGESFDLVKLYQDNKRYCYIVLAGLVNIIFKQYAQCGKITRDDFVMNLKKKHGTEDCLTQKEWDQLLKPGEGLFYQVGGLIGKTTNGDTMLTARAFEVSRGPDEQSAPGYQGTTELIFEWMHQNWKDSKSDK